MSLIDSLFCFDTHTIMFFKKYIEIVRVFFVGASSPLGAFDILT